jgi:hypothetical protein
MVMASIALVWHAGQSKADTILVTTTEDSGPGSLRDAIALAGATPGIDEIRFQLGGTPDPSLPPPPANFTIRLFSTLIIDTPVFIDGTSQAGYSDRPVIEITSNIDTPGPDDGILLASGSDGSTIKGLAVTDSALGSTAIPAGTGRAWPSTAGTTSSALATSSPGTASP